jgi:hypothetical protein
MSLRVRGQQRRHALFTGVTNVTNVTDVTDDVMLSAVRGERRRGNGTPQQRQRQRTIAYLGTLPHEEAGARERARFWESLLPRLNRLGLEPAAYEHLMAQLMAVVPPPTKRELAAADCNGAERAAKHAVQKVPFRRRRAPSQHTAARLHAPVLVRSRSSTEQRESEGDHLDPGRYPSLQLHRFG